MKIKEIIWTNKFERELKKVKDASFLEKVKKRIRKIIQNPNFGKPLRYGLRGEKTIWIKPYRLIFKVEEDKLILLRLEHRKKVYRVY